MNDVISPKIKQTFNPQKLDGIWYEHKYEDLAQLGLSCQTINNTYNQQNNEINQIFKGYYGIFPFSLSLSYIPQDQVGVYNRYAFQDKSILFPCAIIDVIEDQNGQYIGYADYLCSDIKITQYQEIRFNTREKQPDMQIISKLIQSAQNQIKGFNQNQLKNVDYQKC